MMKTANTNKNNLAAFEKCKTTVKKHKKIYLQNYILKPLYF